MKMILRIAVLCTAMFFIACDSNEIQKGEEQTIIEVNDLITLNDDLSTLNKRMKLVGENSSRRLTARAIAPENSLFLNEIATYVNGASNIQATHVAIKGTFAYVSYGTIGNAYGGTIDVINFADINNPVVVKQATIANADIISLAVSGNHLIIAAATDLAAPKTVFGRSAIVINMTLGNDHLLSDNYVVTEVQGHITTDVAADDKYYYVSTGANGAISKFSLTTNEFVSRIERSDLRSIAINNNNLATLSGDEGINVFNNSGTFLSFLKNFPNSEGDNLSGTKRTLTYTADGTKIVAAHGLNGIGVYNSSTGDLIQTVALANAGGDHVTNAVSVESDYAFAAHGASGLFAYKISNTATPLSKVGNITLAGSANYAKASGDIIFVACGTAGLKIVKKLDTTINPPVVDPPVANTLFDGICTAVSPESNIPSNAYTTWQYQGNAKDISGPTTLSSASLNNDGFMRHCGNLTVNDNFNFNGGNATIDGTLTAGATTINASSTLIVRNTTINGNFTLNGGIAIIEGTLNQGTNFLTKLDNQCKLTFKGGTIGSLQIDGGTITIEGTLNVQNLRITANSKIKFVGSGSKIVVNGTISDPSNLLVGTEKTAKVITSNLNI